MGVTPGELGIWIFITDPVIDFLRGLGFYIRRLEVGCDSGYDRIQVSSVRQTTTYLPGGLLQAFGVILPHKVWKVGRSYDPPHPPRTRRCDLVGEYATQGTRNLAQTHLGIGPSIIESIIRQVTRSSDDSFLFPLYHHHTAEFQGRGFANRIRDCLHAILGSHHQVSWYDFCRP